MRLRQREPGRTRVRLAKLLEETLPDIKVDPRELYPATGWYRTSNSIFNDTYRWEGFGKLGKASVAFYCWDTMTLCVKHGIEVVRETPTSIVVYAKAPA